MADAQYMEFDRARLDRLRKAYKQAVDAGAESFIFDTVPMLTAYAKYLIEYLDTKLS